MRGQRAGRGVLITFEGVEGAGKTTQLQALARWLARRGRRVMATREPDGTRLGLAVRRLFEVRGRGPRGRRAEGPDALGEALLFLAARHQHVTERLAPWLARGRVVLCDRYTDATLAYQGYGRGLDRALLGRLNALATGGLRPRLTLLFDIDPAVGFQRIGRRRRDRFEREALAFHRRVRRGYLAIQRAEPGRVRVIDAARAPSDVAADVRAIVDRCLDGA